MSERRRRPAGLGAVRLREHCDGVDTQRIGHPSRTHSQTSTMERRYPVPVGDREVSDGKAIVYVPTLRRRHRGFIVDDSLVS
jgi:hypothetical protein